jgi:hypothetical protein
MKTSRASSRGSTASDREPRRQHGRHVLGRMHREVDARREQRLLDLLGEQALAADLRQRRSRIMSPLVRMISSAMRSARSACAAARRAAHLPRLRQRERAAARADAQHVSATREDCTP